MSTPYRIGTASSATPAVSKAVTVSTATKAGDQILVAVSAPSASTAVGGQNGLAPASISVTDSSGNNNYILASVNATSKVFIFMSTGNTGALTTSNTITVTFGASSEYSIVAVGCSGIMYQGIDVQVAANGTSSAPSVTTPDTHYSSEMAFAICFNNSASAPSAWGSGWTAVTSGNVGTAGPGDIAIAYQALTGTSNSTQLVASATTGNVAWAMTCIVMINQMWTPGTIPSLNSIPAGYIVQPGDMNSMSLVAAFLLTKPLARVQDFTGAQAITTTGGYVNFSSATRDTDGLWQPGVDTTRLTVNTPGFYKIRYGVIDTGTSFNAWVNGTGGPNNPKVGSGTSEWGSFSAGKSSIGGAGCSGLWPYYLYQGDYLRVYAQYSGGTVTTATTDSGSFFSMEWVGF